MLTYNTAKRLKEAGFPQFFGEAHFYYTHSGGVLSYIALGAKEEKTPPSRFWFFRSLFQREFGGITLCPTLPELIEACIKLTEQGDIHLEHIDGQWHASSCYLNGEWQEWFDGDSAEQAVAELWLALKANKDV